MKRIFGFTLAEILVALTIIGVVSALVVPRVAGNTTKKQFTTKFKTTMNVLDAAAKEFKVQEGGYDYTGDKTHVAGMKNIADVLMSVLNAQLVKTGQYNVTGWMVSGGQALADGEIQPLYLFTEETLGYKYTNSINLTLPFGEAFNNNDCFNSLTSKTAGGTRTGSNSISGATACSMTFNQLPDSFTLKLHNGAYIFIPKNAAGCNYNNVRWDGDDEKYLTPNHLGESNSETNTNLCVAYIDVNGSKGPNKLTSCGGDNYFVHPGSDQTCNVTYTTVADVFPVVFFDDSVYPANTASNTVWLDQISD